MFSPLLGKHRAQGPAWTDGWHCFHVIHSLAAVGPEHRPVAPSVGRPYFLRWSKEVLCSLLLPQMWINWSPVKSLEKAPLGKGIWKAQRENYWQVFLERRGWGCCEDFCERLGYPAFEQSTVLVSLGCPDRTPETVGLNRHLFSQFWTGVPVWLVPHEGSLPGL